MSDIKKEKDSNYNLIWESRLDSKYYCTVIRISERKGILKVINEENQQVLLETEVGLSYGAIFGPDMDDVRDWEETAIDVVDKQ